MASNQPSISLISTLAEDVLINTDGQIISKSKGGPALFVGNALAAEGIAFELFEAPPLRIEILVTPKDECSKTPAPPQQSFISPKILKDYTIVSTILDEWQFSSGLLLPPRMFVDVQGFVREAQKFGDKKAWKVNQVLADQIFCIKGTAEEIKYLPEAVLERQKQRLLIITRGKDGVEMFYKGKRRHFNINEVKGLKHTIGAGDTFMGHFVAKIYKGAPVVDAARYAILDVVAFLKQKQDQHLP